jgi:hypothetical protein
MSKIDAIEGAFVQELWEALKGDHNDLRREKVILQAFREAQNAYASASDARVGELEGALRRCDALAIAALIDTTKQRQQRIQDALDDVLGIARAALAPTPGETE